MKKGLAAIALAAVLILSWVIPAAAGNPGDNQGGYSGNSGSSGGSNWATSFYYQLGSGTVTAQLIAGKMGEVGTVTVWESPDNTNGKNINVEYDTVVGWNLTETDLYVGRGMTCDNAENKIPQDRTGNYNPDMFKNKNTFTTPISTFTYPPINEKGLGSGSWLCIAAYAELQSTDGSKTGKAWGDIFPVGQWKLPTNPITLEVWDQPGPNNHFFDLILSNVDAGYSIGDGHYGGWCADNKIGIDFDIYSVNVYSSLNLTSAPLYIKNSRQWDMINYVINHYVPGTDYSDVQDAIWYFTNNSTDQTTISQGLVNDAAAHGKGFVPGAGQIGAVILDPGEDLQPTFIELFAPTKCLKENSCRYNCNPGWSPCQNNWQPTNGSTCPQDWNPCSAPDHNGTPKFAPQYKWDSKSTPQQNLDHFRALCNIGYYKYKVTITKTGELDTSGSTWVIHYTYTVTNVGSVTLYNVAINDDKLGTIIAASKQINLSPPPPATQTYLNSVTRNVDYLVKPDDVSPIVNVATVSAQYKGGGVFKDATLDPPYSTTCTVTLPGPGSVLPELPAGVLLGVGLAGVGGFIMIKRRARVVTGK